MKDNFISHSTIRLKEERKRLGLKDQAEAAGLCGVSREMWGKYERGKSVPGGEVLFSFAAAGADVQYIFTGQRSIKEDSKSGAVADLPLLSTESAVRVEGVQAEILKKNLLYRLKEDTKDHGKQAAEGLAGYQPLRPDQLALLDNLAHCPEEVQDAIRKLALVSARSDKDKKESGTK